MDIPITTNNNLWNKICRLILLSEKERGIRRIANGNVVSFVLKEQKNNNPKVTRSNLLSCLFLLDIRKVKINATVKNIAVTSMNGVPAISVIAGSDKNNKTDNIPW